MVAIRKFIEQDSEQAVGVIKRAVLEVNSKDYPPEVIRNLCECFTPEMLIESSKFYDCYVAEHNGKILGTIRIREDSLYTLFVDPKYHRRGIGRLLMKTAEQVVKKKGFNIVRLAASITAVEFYKKLGYIDTGVTHEDEYGLTHIMTKTI